MSKLSILTLGDLIEFQRGYDLPKSEFKKGNVPVISSNGVLGYHNEVKVKAPGITIGRSGTVGFPHFIKEDFFPHNTSLFVKDEYAVTLVNAPSSSRIFDLIFLAIKSNTSLFTW